MIRRRLPRRFRLLRAVIEQGVVMNLPDLDHPNCLCGRPMQLRTIEPVANSNETHVHTFVCVACSHELRVMNDRADYERRAAGAQGSDQALAFDDQPRERWARIPRTNSSP